MPQFGFKTPESGGILSASTSGSLLSPQDFGFSGSAALSEPSIVWTDNRDLGIAAGERLPPDLEHFLSNTGQLGLRCLYQNEDDCVRRVSQNLRFIGLLTEHPRLEFNLTGAGHGEQPRIIASISYQLSPIFRGELLGRVSEMIDADVASRTIHERIVSAFPARWSVVEGYSVPMVTNGDNGFLAYATVIDGARGQNHSLRLIQGALTSLRGLGAEYAVAYARVAEFKGFLTEQFPKHAENQITLAALAQENIHDYVHLRRPSDGLHPDWGIRFHQRGGARIACGLPDCSLDAESLGQGAFMLYDLRRL